MLSRRAVAALAVLSSSALIVLLRRHLLTVCVEGPSMLPSIGPGDRLLVLRLRPGKISTGDIVVFAEPDLDGTWKARRGGRTAVPGGQWVIKRVAAAPGEEVPAAVAGSVSEPVVPVGNLVVLGDNPAASRDSRDWGLIPGPAVLGKVVRVLARAGR